MIYAIFLNDRVLGFLGGQDWMVQGFWWSSRSSNMDLVQTDVFGV